MRSAFFSPLSSLVPLSERVTASGDGGHDSNDAKRLRSNRGETLIPSILFLAGVLLCVYPAHI